MTLTSKYVSLSAYRMFKKNGASYPYAVVDDLDYWVEFYKETTTHEQRKTILYQRGF